MSKQVKIALLALLVIGVAGGIAGLAMFNKSHKNLAAAEADYTVEASQIFSEFETDEAAASTRYLEKVVQVSGLVQEKQETADGGIIIVLKGESDMFGVNCAFLPEAATSVSDLKIGATAQIRGICTGYLMDVNLARCIVVI